MKFPLMLFVNKNLQYFYSRIYLTQTSCSCNANCYCIASCVKTQYFFLISQKTDYIYITIRWELMRLFHGSCYNSESTLSFAVLCGVGNNSIPQFSVSIVILTLFLSQIFTAIVFFRLPTECACVRVYALERIMLHTRSSA